MKPYRIVFTLLLTAASFAQLAPRARDLGIPFDGTRGTLNAITDIAGVEVGFTTLISGEGKLVVGKGPARTGVTLAFRTKTTLDRSSSSWPPTLRCSLRNSSDYGEAAK